MFYLILHVEFHVYMYLQWGNFNPLFPCFSIEKFISAFQIPKFFGLHNLTCKVHGTCACTCTVHVHVVLKCILCLLW